MITKIRTLGRKIIDWIMVQLFILNLRACFPELKNQTLRSINEGGDNYTVEFDDGLILQTPRRKEDWPRMEMEHRLLSFISHEFKTLVPHPLYFSDGSGKCGTMIIGYRKIEGTGLDAAGDVPGDPDSLPMEIADFLAKLHNLHGKTDPELAFCNSKTGRYSKKHEDAINFFRKKGHEILGADDYGFVNRYIESVLDKGEICSNGSIIHHDLRAEHILVDRESGRISGVIDWMDGCIGDPSEDFAFIIRDLGYEFYRKVMNYYKSTEKQDIARRSFFYSILSFFNDITRCYERDRPKACDLIENLHNLIEVLRNNADILNAS